MVRGCKSPSQLSAGRPPLIGDLQTIYSIYSQLASLRGASPSMEERTRNRHNTGCLKLMSQCLPIKDQFQNPAKIMCKFSFFHIIIYKIWFTSLFLSSLIYRKNLTIFIFHPSLVTVRCTKESDFF
jgi:hypothetical protein